ncbi:MAG: pseudouridine synthase [Ktedonobacteraceae bacterium]
MNDRQHEDKQGMLEGERLARFLAHAGVASRRHAEELIAAGRVQVNGVTVSVPGARINPAVDRVSVDGRLVQAVQQHVYVLLNKPAGYVSTARDPQGRPTVLDLLPPELRRLRVYPVGRLDIDTSGLLLLSNDGNFALRMAHPRYSMEKHYEALVQGQLAPAELADLRNGVTIREDDGGIHQTAPAQVRLIRRVGADSRVALTIHEGHKRQVRRMFAAVGHQVRELSRVGLGPLTLHDVPEGKWRSLTSAELQLLQKEPAQDA